MTQPLQHDNKSSSLIKEKQTKIPQQPLKKDLSIKPQEKEKPSSSAKNSNEKKPFDKKSFSSPNLGSIPRGKLAPPQKMSDPSKEKQIVESRAMARQILENSVNEKIKSLKGSNIRVALFKTHNGTNDDVKQSLEKLERFGIKITVICTKNILHDDAQFSIEARDWSQEDVFFCYGGGPSKSSWFGDFLSKQLKKGKGIVICYSFTIGNESKSDYLSGDFVNDAPFVTGPNRNDDGTKRMIKIIEDHPILQNVESFNGGPASFRAAIQVVDPKIGEKIAVVANWNDDDNSPLIIAKEYTETAKPSPILTNTTVETNAKKNVSKTSKPITPLKEKEGATAKSKQQPANLAPNWGNIVILNFFQPSGALSAQWWDPKTDGDKIMQNSVVWAAKRFPEQQELQNLIGDEEENEKKMMKMKKK